MGINCRLFQINCHSDFKSDFTKAQIHPTSTREEAYNFEVAVNFFLAFCVFFKKLAIQSLSIIENI